MSLNYAFREMIRGPAERYAPPPIEDVFFPPFHKGGRPRDARFTALRLEGEATGISYLLLSDAEVEACTALEPKAFVSIIGPTAIMTNPTERKSCR